MAKGKIKDPRRVHDYWTQKAKAEKYPARSVYKLEEADQKYYIIKPGNKVLDLGAAPGSWLLYTAAKIGPQGLVVGLDLKEPDQRLPENARFIKGDVLEIPWEELLEHGPFDVVLSDLAPATTGVKSTDQHRSLQLARAAWALAGRVLKPKGAFMVKVFQGPEVETLFEEVRTKFEVFRRIKPKSSRSFSPEIFGLGLGFLGEFHKIEK